MPTGNKTYVFLSDLEGLSDIGPSTILTPAWLSSDGDPANGCLRWTNGSAVGADTTETSRAAESSVTGTWASLFGIPTGKEVLDAQVTGYYDKLGVMLIGLGGTASARSRIRFADSGHASVLSADLIDRAAPAGGSGWTSEAAGSVVSVIAGKRSASTLISLEPEFEVTTVGATATNIDYRIDSIACQITYAAGSGESFAGVDRRKRRKTVVLKLGGGGPSVGVMAAAGRLLFAQLPDGRGAKWRTEVAVAQNADYTSGAVLYDGRQWIAIYTSSGAVFVAKSGNPSDWTKGVKSNTGLAGRVYGAARNSMGVICALIGTNWYLSRDLGNTWHLGGTAPWPVPATIQAIRDMFYVQAPTGATPKHWMSQDSGATFV